MKNLIMIAFGLMSMVKSYAQDKIIQRGGDTIEVNITKNTPELVEFTYPNETLINVLYKNSISKIIYISGRIEEVSGKLNLYNINGIEDWEKVAVTYTESDIKGMTKVKEISRSSGWGGSMLSGMGYNKALKKIKRDAAKLKCPIVWLVDFPTKEAAARGGGVKLVAVAYK